MTTYSDEFIERCFSAWYNSSRSSGVKFKELLGETEESVPSYTTVNEWASKYGWYERADSLDAQITVRNDNEIVNSRAEMFKKQVEYSNRLIEEGMKYLNENGITSDNAAIRAIDLGLSTQRVTVGMAESYVKISKMGNDELQKELQKLLGVKSDEDTVDAEVEED